MSAIRVPIQSDPAAATSPAIVSISGSPAATREPKASTRIASVTGHEISSDFIIADLFAWLKSDHMPGAPVRLTCTPSAPSLASWPFRSSAARTMAFALRAAPARITATWRSGEIETPATLLIAGLAFSSSSTLRRTRSNAGSDTVLCGAWTTTDAP